MDCVTPRLPLAANGVIMRTRNLIRSMVGGVLVAAVLATPGVASAADGSSTSAPSGTVSGPDSGSSDTDPVADNTEIGWL